MLMKTQKVPRQALIFNEQSDGVLSLSQTENEGKKLSMLAYSGALMDHWYWGKVAVDVGGVKFGRKPFPILEDHSTEKKIGIAFSVDISNNQIFFPEIKPLKNKFSEEVLSNMESEFPYQASISIKPTRIEEIKEGTDAEVNGAKVKGPATIFRESLFRESSVCVFGVDNKTNVKAFSEREEDLVEFSYSVVEEEIVENTETEEKIMDLKELKEKHPNLVFSIEQEITDKMNAGLKEKDDKIGELNQEIASLGEKFKTQDEQIQEFSRKEEQRKEQDLKALADQIVSEMLSACELPTRVHDKIKKFINYNDFVNDNKLDEVALKAKMETEIKEWEDTFTESAPVIGVGKRTTNNTDEENVDRLFKSVQG